MNSFRSRNVIDVINEARTLITLPAEMTEAVDSIDALAQAVDAIVDPPAPASPSMAELLADPTGHAAALLAHEADAQVTARARALLGARSQSISSLGLKRLLDQHGEALVTGPIRDAAGELIDTARPLVPVLDDYGRDGAHVAAHGTPAALESWQTYRTLQHHLDVLVALWRLLVVTSVNAPTSGPWGGPAGWARPDLVVPEQRGTFPPADLTTAGWKNAPTDLLVIAAQDPAAGWRLLSAAELKQLEVHAQQNFSRVKAERRGPRVRAR